MANIKAIYLDSNGVMRPAGSSDTIDVGDIKLINQNVADGVLSTDSTGAVASAKLVNANVDANAGIAYGKLDLAGSITNSDVASNAAIADTKLATISTANKVSNSATTATDSNTGSAIVSRDASGNFSAGTITADLSGNASTASAWHDSRTVTFAGGNVTGSFSIDGSANVSSVALTIGADQITNSMIVNDTIEQSKLSGNIPDGKLQTISTAGKVADTALSSNVAKYDDAAPSFDNKLGVAAVTAADVTKAADVQFVLDQVAAATAGIDYKQESKWYWDLANNGGAFSQPATKAGFLAGVNAAGNQAPFAAGDRILLNDSSAANVDVGIWVFGGTTGSFTMARASDMAAGSSATGAWVYCLQTLGQGGAAALGQSYVCNTAAPATVGTTATQFVLYAAGKTYTASSPLVMTGTDVSLTIGNGLYTDSGALTARASATGALSVSAQGIAAEVDNSTIQISANQLAFKSLPSQFKINGSAVSADVTSGNLNTLTGGTSEDGSFLHRHEMVLNLMERDSGQASFTIGTPVIANNSGKLVRASAAVGKCFGLVFEDAAGVVLMASAGLIELSVGSIWTSSAPANGEAVYLGDSGKLAKYSDLASGDFVTKVGRLQSGGRLLIAIQDVGVKP